MSFDLVGHFSFANFPNAISYTELKPQFPLNKKSHNVVCHFNCCNRTQGRFNVTGSHAR